MRNEKWIWCDMDGCIADLYSVDNWLADLRAENTRPYALAKSLYNDIDLLNTFLKFKEIGYKIGIISWGSKNATSDYDLRVRQTKINWLTERGYDLILDKIIVTAYGVCKADTCKQFGQGVLIDDEKQNRDNWYLGQTIDATKNIITELEKLLEI